MLFTKLTFLDADGKTLGKPILAKSQQEALRTIQTTKSWSEVEVSQETERGAARFSPTWYAREKEAASNLLKELPKSEAEYEKKFGRIISPTEDAKEQKALARAFASPDMAEFRSKKCWTPYFRTLERMVGIEKSSFDAVSLLGFAVTQTPGDVYYPYIHKRDKGSSGGGMTLLSKYNELTAKDPLFFDILTAYALVQDGLCSAENPKDDSVLDQRYGIDDAFVQSIQKELFAKYDRVRVQDLIDLLQKRSPASLANVLVRYEETKDAAEAAEAAHASEGSKTLDIPDDTSSEAATKTVPPKTPVSLLSIGQWFTSTTLSCPSVGNQKALTQTVPTNNLHLVSGDWQEITNQNEACKVDTSLSPVKVLGTALGLGVMVAGLGLLIKK